MILHLDLGIWKELSTFFLTESNTILAILSRFYTFILRSKTFVHYIKSKIHDSYFFQLGTLLFPPLDLCKKLLSCKRRAYNVGKKWKKVQRKKNFNFKISQLPFWNYLNESQMKCTFFRILIHFYLPVLPFWITLFQNSKHVLFWTNMKRLTTTTTLMYLQQHYNCKGHILPEYKSNLKV